MNVLHALYQPTPEIRICLVRVADCNEGMSKELPEVDQQRLSNISHPHKRLEFIASRKAMQILKADYRLYYEGRCPILEGPGFISISHSNEFGAAIHHPTRRVGLDVEPLRPQLHKLKTKFLNEFEQNSIRELHINFQLQILWGAKESLFKLHRMGGLEFKQHMHVESIIPEPKGSTGAKIETLTENIPCIIRWFMHEDQYVVFAESKIKI